MKGNVVKIIVIFLIIIVLGVFGYFLYDKFFGVKMVIKQEDDIVALDKSFYDVNSLVNNRYISPINSVDQKKYDTNEQVNPYMIKIDNGRVFVANDLALDDEDIKLVEASGVVGTPSVVKYLNYLDSGSSVFFVLTSEGDLYYADTYKKDDSVLVNSFTKISKEKITGIYDFYTDINITYPWHPLTIYAYGDNGKLMKVNSGLVSSYFEDDYPLPDQICGGWSDRDSCVGLYISPDRYLYLVKDKDNNLYQELFYRNDKIKVKDAFSVTKISALKNGNAKLDKIVYYIIGEDNYLYEITENDDYEIVSIDRYSDSKLLSYNFSIEDNKYIVSVNFDNGDKDYFKDVSVFSTLYYRYNK